MHSNIHGNYYASVGWRGLGFELLRTTFEWNELLYTWLERKRSEFQKCKQECTTPDLTSWIRDSSTLQRVWLDYDDNRKRETQ